MKQRANFKKEHIGICFTTIAILSVILAMLSMMSVHLTDANPYNTYALQADSWRQGRLDLGKDYPWLELAIYDGKYFCSFPPFPSYVLFPLTFIFGSQTPDYLVLIALNILACTYLYMFSVKMGASGIEAGWLTILATLGSNTLFIMLSPGVWFMAQMMCFVTAIMALYYAKTGNVGVSLFLWGASVGCRPMQILYLPILMLFSYENRSDPNEKTGWLTFFLHKWKELIPTGVLALSYMSLNFFRFGNIFEFGHNYLPEFVRAEYGQFHLSYLKQNWRELFRLPRIDDSGRIVINHFGGLNIFIVNPILLLFLIGVAYAILKKDKQIIRLLMTIAVLSTAYLLVIASHRTLGGWHFGNRYAIDLLPYVFAGVTSLRENYQRWIRVSVPVAILWGCIVNIIGTIIVYTG